MGEPPKRGDGTDPSTAAYVSLVEAIKTNEQLPPVPKATVKGMVPLERPPAEPSGEPTDD